MEIWLSKLGLSVSVILTIIVMVAYILIDNSLVSRMDAFKLEVERNPGKYTKL